MYDLFMSAVGCQIQEKMHVPQIVKIFRLVDDFLVILKDASDIDVVTEIVLHVFVSES